MTDKLEFYLNHKKQPFLTIESSFAPNKGDLVNIEKTNYMVLGRSFTVDHAADIQLRCIRCNVIVTKSRKR